MALAPIACLVAAGYMLLTLPRQAEAGSAERRVADVLEERGYRAEAVRCRPSARPGRAVWRCRWRGTKASRRAGRRCRGTHQLLRESSRWRQRLLSRRCHVTRRAVAPRDRLERLGPLGPHPHFGLNEDWHLWPGQLALAGRIGADAARVPVWWTHVESRGPDLYDWAVYDRLFAELRAQGIRPILAVQYAPCWARLASQCPGDGGGYPPLTEFEPEWEEFVGLVAQRYPDALAIEVWNEPNLRIFFHDPDPERYARLLERAHRAVKSVAPTMPVIGGGPAPVTPGADHTSSDRIDYRVFLDRVLRAGGARHLLSTGVSRRVTEAVQARELGTMYRTARRMRGIRSFIVHRLLDVPQRGPWESGVGLLRTDFSPKPVYCRFAIEREAPWRCS
jgi:hypothetical protein